MIKKWMEREGMVLTCTEWSGGKVGLKSCDFDDKTTAKVRFGEMEKWGR